MNLENQNICPKRKMLSQPKRLYKVLHKTFHYVIFKIGSLCRFFKEEKIVDEDNLERKLVLVSRIQNNV